MKDPACRVAPERGGPSRKRRPSPSSGTATNTPAHPRRPQSVECYCEKFAAQRPNRNGTLARCDASRTSCARACGPAGVRPGERQECLRVSSNTPHPQEREARDRVRPWNLPLILPRSRSSPEGPRLQAWFAQRIERVAARQRLSDVSQTASSKIPASYFQQSHHAGSGHIATASRHTNAHVHLPRRTTGSQHRA